MFDFDAGKFIIIGIVALIVIGPKELPSVMRQVGQAAAKMRRMAAEFRGQFMDAMREADIEEIKADVAKLAESAKADAGLDPLAQIKAELTQALDAARKPAPLPGADGPAITAPHNAESSPNSIAVPRLPEAAEEGAEAGAAAPGQAPAAGVIDAEMRALADALAAEMGDAPRRTEPDGAKTLDIG
ncbi:MAG TPA: twin-arginine translocase TatA/TatE family subunit [Methylocella sp.]|jgi:sec-independent protein translocase protein TatB|nr:twin-arginine translocase TatA/TatE family subunit [Methylocella sp.]